MLANSYCAWLRVSRGAGSVERRILSEAFSVERAQNDLEPDAGHCLLPVSEYRQATMEVNLSTQEADTCDAFYLL